MPAEDDRDDENERDIFMLYGARQLAWSLKIPSWEGQKALAFGVGPPVRDNPPLHPSRGGE